MVSYRVRKVFSNMSTSTVVNKETDVREGLQLRQELGASLQSTLVNVINTIIGAGILSIPSTIHSTGIISSFLFLICSLLLSILGAYYLIVASAYTRQDSFGKIADILYGTVVKSLANVTVLVYELGVSTAYFVILFDQISDLLQTWNIMDTSFLLQNKWVQLVSTLEHSG